MDCESPSRTVLQDNLKSYAPFQDTASYLKQCIERQPDLLGGREWITAIGSETSADARTRELERFCPESVTGEAGFIPEGGEVDVILSTDILSEGQNLQQAQAVLSFDMPWNPQRVVQRNGRIIRLRSPHKTAYLYTLLPKQGDLIRLLDLEAKLQAKIMAANASVGMETPVLADVETESQVYADLNTFAERLASGDATLLDEQESSGETGSAFAGELFRSYLRRAAEEGEIARLRDLPWGSSETGTDVRKCGSCGSGKCLQNPNILDNTIAAVSAIRLRTVGFQETAVLRELAPY